MGSSSRRSSRGSRRQDESAAASSSVKAEQQADRVANVVTRGGAARAGVEWSAAAVPIGTIQRKCADCEQEEQGEQPSRDAPAAAMRQDAKPLLAEDEGDAGPGQMRKGEFLAALRAEICASVDDAMSGTGRDSKGCPWIDHWLGYYEGRTAAQAERALRRYAPEAATAATARDYIPFVAARVRQSAATYAATGEISGVPEDVPAGGAVGGVLAGFGGMFFKARPGGPREPDVGAMRGQLGGGQSLPGSVRRQMEPAFGTSFSGVRLHTDASAAQLSDQLNARAFTVGGDVVFGSGEYQPGTLAGDALIAHELAHVVQQGSGARQAPRARSESSESAFENDADRSAVAAVGATRGAAVGQRARPNLRAGMRLQRCGGEAKPAASPSLQTDKALRKSWDAAFQEGLGVLNAAVKQKGKDVGCEFPGGKPAAEWRYDNDYWKPITGEQEIRKYQIAYEPRRKAHISVDELFKHLEKWECDCALFSELTWLYAWRHSLTDDQFDEKFNNLRLRPHDSAGMERETHVGENFELGLEQGNFGKMWDDAPVGTKVNWTNESVHARSPWQFENAVKSKKGKTPAQDRYDAHPLGANLSEDQIKRALAENSEDFPGNPFVITDQTLIDLQPFGAPAEFLKALEPLKNQSFIGKKAFTQALAAPAQALAAMRQNDRDKYTALLSKLFDSAHLPAKEADKQKYVDQNIKRHEFSVPK